MTTTDKNNKELDPVRYQLLSKVAWLYYHEEIIQAEIADRLGISRVTVNRLLKEARECGLVEIKVHTHYSEVFKLSQRLCQKYALRDAIVLPDVTGEENMQLALAQAAAVLLAQRIQPGMTVGVGIGRTVSHIPDFFHSNAPVSCRFIGLTGGLDLRISGVPHTFDTLGRLAAVVQGEALYIPAPSYVAAPEVQKVLLAEQAVTHALQIAASSDLAIFSLGTIDYSALLYQYKQITDQDLEDMRQRKAVGDVLGRFFNQDGQEIDLDLNQRIIGLRLDELKKIPLKILAAGGKNKQTALDAALIHQFCEILITDAANAAWLLDCNE
jgi:lsr operon transcriptional repressor